jgi:hypothetical protein
MYSKTGPGFVIMLGACKLRRQKLLPVAARSDVVRVQCDLDDAQTQPICS